MKLGMLHALSSIIQLPVMLIMKQRTDVNGEDSDDDEDSISDDEDTDIKDGVFVVYCATTD
eukprot:10778692-Ditylum_brightwellii.AAC.1